MKRHLSYFDSRESLEDSKIGMAEDLGIFGFGCFTPPLKEIALSFHRRVTREIPVIFRAKFTAVSHLKSNKKSPSRKKRRGAGFFAPPIGVRVTFLCGPKDDKDRETYRQMGH